MNNYIINERIRADKLFVVAEKENLGVISRDEALKIAREKELDLVLIAPHATPPVAKILDFSKFLYEEKKKKAKGRVKSKKSELKEIRLGPNTGESDLNIKIEQAKEFIKDGNRVKANIILQGREMAYPEFAYDKLEKIKKGLEDTARSEGEIKRMGRNVFIVFVSK